MNWTQVLTVVIANIGLAAANVSLCVTMFLWLRKEANADRKELAADIKDLRKTAMQDIKDFHARLKVLEERR
jgi:methionine synthase II (cobalamin-independent)